MVVWDSHQATCEFVNWIKAESTYPHDMYIGVRRQVGVGN